MTLDPRPPDRGPAQSRPHGHLGVLKVVVLLTFALLTLRLANMQIVNGAEYRERAANNHIQSQQILPSRGLIYDRNGEALVENVGVYTATLLPEFLPNVTTADTWQDQRWKIYGHLEDMLGVSALALDTQVREAEAADVGYRAIAVKTNLTQEEALMLSEAEVDLPGVTLTVTPGREYTGGDAFSPILGYIGPQTAEEWDRFQHEGYEFNQPVGKTGVELRYEKDLRGKAGVSANEVDADGDLINVLDTVPPTPGNSLRLAIDAEMQRYVENLLLTAMGSPAYRATKASAVVMDVETGEVLSIVSVPGWDNNIFGNLRERSDEYLDLIEDPRKPLLNQAINPASPGSTFKLITAAAALQEGNATPNTTRNIPTVVKEFVGENGTVYPYFDWRAHGPIDLYEAIAWSSNLYMFQISCGFPDEGIKGLGDDVYDSARLLAFYARSFGLGRETGIDIPGEVAGIIPTPEWKRESRSDPEIFHPEDAEWYHADTCFTSVGQGDVLATPLQIAVMTAAVANNGKVLVPHVVDAVLSPEGEVVREIPTQFDQVPVSDEHLEAVRVGMLRSVQDGAGSRASQPGLDIAGKTGTSEFVLPDGRVDEHAWFTGFYPYYDPQIAVTVYFDLGIGGNDAAPIAGRIFSYYAENMQP